MSHSPKTWMFLLCLHKSKEAFVARADWPRGRLRNNERSDGEYIMWGCVSHSKDFGFYHRRDGKPWEFWAMEWQDLTYILTESLWILCWKRLKEAREEVGKLVRRWLKSSKQEVTAAWSRMEAVKDRRSGQTRYTLKVKPTQLLNSWIWEGKKGSQEKELSYKEKGRLWKE